jgi:hypothetical protein
MRFPQKLVHDMKTNIEPTMLEIYLPPNVNVTQVKERMNQEEGYVAESQLDGLKETVLGTV